MEGVLNSFRSGKRTRHNSQMILIVPAVDSKEKTASLMGKTVTWKSPAGKELKGKVVSPHGSKGAVRVKFATGMPGQAIGQKVTVA